MHYLTENGVDISQRIRDGRTHLFEGLTTEDRNKACEKANDIGSYVYEVFSINKDHKHIHIGFAVPR